MRTDRPIWRKGDLSRRVETAVVIPTFNEGENLASMCETLPDLDVPNVGIIVVDDGSPDGTGEIADEIADSHPGRMAVIHRSGKLGLGTAYMEGFRYALQTDTRNIVQMDCDFSHPPALVPELIRCLERADVVVGSRYCEGGGSDPDWSTWRAMLSRYANFGIRSMLGLQVRDATSGFKAYRRVALESIDLDALELTGFGFQAEVAFRMQRAGLDVMEQPYTFMERAAGSSKMSLGIAVEAAWRLTKLRLGG